MLEQAESEVVVRDGLYAVDRPPKQPLAPWWDPDHVVLLVHGAMDRAAGLARVARRLPEFPVVRYDRRGYGRSASKGGGRLAEHVDDLFTVLAGRRAFVVGHSFGALVALAAAVRAPGQVQGVLAYEPPMPWAPWWPTWPLVEGGVVRADDDAAAESAESFLRGMLGDAVWERLPTRTREARRSEGPAMLREMASISADTAPFDLRAVAVPLTVVHGSRTSDRHIRAAQELAESVAGAHAEVIVGAGHGAPASHPDALADLTVRAAKGLSSAR